MLLAITHKSCITSIDNYANGYNKRGTVDAVNVVDDEVLRILSIYEWRIQFIGLLQFPISLKAVLAFEFFKNDGHGVFDFCHSNMYY